MNAPTATEERVLDVLRELTPAQRVEILHDLERLIELDGRQVGYSTKYMDMREGDMFPNGSRVAKVEQQAGLVRLTVENGINPNNGLPFVTEFHWVDGFETYSESIDRANFYASMADHS